MPRRRTRLTASALAAGAVYAVVVRPWHLRWGATGEEVTADLPGDGIVERPHLCATRAIDIVAPPEAIWPWLVQMGGYTRAGWYSYDHVDNAGRPSADRIILELQRLRVGDVLPTAPNGEGFTVERLVPNRHLVMAIHNPHATTSVACVLRPVSAIHTRLLGGWGGRGPCAV
jgi:hypothetical protein